MSLDWWITNPQLKNNPPAGGQIRRSNCLLFINGLWVYPVQLGANWNAIGAEGLGTSGCIINSLCLFNDSLIAGGNFGKDEINNLFRWNGTSWLPFQQFIHGNVLSLCNFNDTLYICGDIEYIDTLKIHGIAKLSDDSWANLSDSIKGKVFNMIVCDGQLYFSGLFGYINENSSGIIASYNGSSINGLGDGVTCFITGMHSFDNKLYIAGEFIDVNGVSTHKIVSWNGSSWETCSFNLNNISQITSISHYGNSIIIAGHLNDVNNNVKKIMQNIQQ